MRKWVSLDENNKIVGVFESDIEQLHASEILYDVDVTTLVDKIFVDSYTVKEDPEVLALAWRDQQLAETAWSILATDHPDYQAYLAYREELVNWPSTADFPETRPALNIGV